jgi:hypothetical protein
MNEAEFDCNVSNYTVRELLAILDLNSDADENDILSKIDLHLMKYANKSQKWYTFFSDIRTRLMDSLHIFNHTFSNLGDGVGSDDDNDDDEYQYTSTNENSKEGFTNNNGQEDDERKVEDWFENQYIEQKDIEQRNKITQRKQKIDIMDDQHLPMKREQLATTDTFGLPVKQDSLNPNLKNTITRFINLDSQFRQFSSVNNSSTDYSLELSDIVKNALQISLYSYQIPFSWYTIDRAYGNTCFWIVDPISTVSIPIVIPSGNYTQTAFQTQLNKSFQQSNISTPPVGEPYNLPANNPVYYNPSNGKITLFLYDGSFNDPSGVLPSFTINSSTVVVFFDFTGELQCNVNCTSKSRHFFNNTLGWIMGYKVPYMVPLSEGNEATAILDLNGTKYLILSVDDYNQNHVNNGIISITPTSNTLKIPSYYSNDIPYTCVRQENTLFNSISNVNQENERIAAGKFENDYVPTQIMLPSAPRTLTNAQLYTINAINSNNNNLTNYLAKAPTSSNILAILPVKTSVGVPTGSLLVEFSGSLQDNTRTYFGPVNIERMSVKLMDDKGNILNLNGNDWCFTLVCECLYQY